MKHPMNQLPGVDHQFQNTDLLQSALTHRSHSGPNNERLEFLGDAILSMVIAAELYDQRPDVNEGSLSRLRSRVVRGESLAKVAKQLGLGDHLQMGEGELKSGGYLRDSVLADALEAVLGAVYLDGGFESVTRVIKDIFGPVVEALPDAESLKDPKTRLQEWLQARGRPLPVYELIKEEGAQHAKRFEVRCRLEDDQVSSTASGTSRRKSEQAAAAELLKQFKALDP